MVWPNVFIVGAPKCGTTSLARWLTGHPSVYMSATKEPHYYSTDLANRTIRSPNRYRALFRGAGDEHLAVVEASTWYLFSEEAVPAIEGEVPAARYIVMTRDPVAMAHSLYHHNLRVLHEDRQTFEEAWALQAERAAGREIPKTCTEPAFLQYHAACSLGSLLDRLYARVDEDRVLHIALEDMQADPAAEYRRVQAFLGLPDEGRTIFPVANEARGHRSRVLQRAFRLGARLRKAFGIQQGFGLAKVNEREQPKAPLSESFRHELDAAFVEERTRLDALRAGCGHEVAQRESRTSDSRTSDLTKPVEARTR